MIRYKVVLNGKAVTRRALLMMAAIRFTVRNPEPETLGMGFAFFRFHGSI